MERQLYVAAQTPLGVRDQQIHDRELALGGGLNELREGLLDFDPGVVHVGLQGLLERLEEPLDALSDRSELEGHLRLVRRETVVLKKLRQLGAVRAAGPGLRV